MPLLDNYLPGGGFQSSGLVRTLGGRLPSRDWVRARQPYLDARGRPCVTVTDLDGGYTRNDSAGGEPKPLLRAYTVAELFNRGYPVPLTANATTLTKAAWIELDRKIFRAYRQRLKAASALEASASFGGVDAMRKMTLETQRMSDPGEAVVDMLGRTEGRTDSPLFDLVSLPLPLTHADFGYADREIGVSLNSEMPLDTAMGEAASRRVGEAVEDQVIGNVTGVTYATQTSGYGATTGSSTVYGWKTFPARLTKNNMTVPTGSNGNQTLTDILAALNQLQNQWVYGPFTIFHSVDWSPFMNNVFSVSGGNQPGETLRSMILKNPDIKDVVRLDRLTDTFTMLFVALDGLTTDMVNAMEISTIQWEERGGLEKRFKVLACKVPRVRADFNNRTGILQATTT